jgi:hypothetical protein
MTRLPNAHGQDTPVRRYLRSLRRWTGIIAMAALAGLGPFSPPPPPPPIPKIEAGDEDREASDDDDP